MSVTGSTWYNPPEYYDIINDDNEVEEQPKKILEKEKRVKRLQKAVKSINKK